MPAVAQIEPASDLEGLKEFERPTALRVNGRTHNASRGYRWCISPNIERASAAHVVEEPIAAKERSGPEKAVSSHIFSAAEVTSYTELIAGIRQKLAALGIRYVDFDDLAGFPSGLTGKAFGPSQVKRLGPEKLFDALRAAGLRIRIENDPEQHAKMSQRIAENYNPRQANQARPLNDSRRSKNVAAVLSYLANNKPGGLTLLNKAVKEAHSNWGRRAQRARCRKGMTPCS
jgi:hypothetical protein